jgi:hypothetical protein
MAGGGYRGILAAVPPAQRLRSASGKGAADLEPKQSNGKINSFASRLAHIGSVYSNCFSPPHNGSAYGF